MSSGGTWSNWTGAPSADLTLDKLVATAAKVKAMGPIMDDITVSPDIADKARALALEHSGPITGAIHVWEDNTLPPSTWHRGKPLREQLRTAPLPPIGVFPPR